MSTTKTVTPDSVDDPASEDESPALDPEVWDENGMARPGKNIYINDLQPTTTFHPYELPSHPVARRAFPKNLISEEGGFAESPMGAVSPEVRAAKGKFEQERADKTFASVLAASEKAREIQAAESTVGTQGGETAAHAQETNGPDEY